MSRSLYVKILLSMALVLAIACGKEVDTPSPVPEVQTVHYKATIQTGSDTRATVGEDMKYKFEAGDRVYIESVDKKLYGFLTLSTDGSAGNNVALFEGNLNYEGETPFQRNDNPGINLVLVSKDDLHTIEEGKVLEVNKDSYLQDGWAPTLEEAVSRFSHFIGSGKFNDNRFTLYQQSSFLRCSVRFKPDEVPDDRVVTADLYNNSSSLLRAGTSISVGEAGSASFVFAFLAGEQLSDAVLHVEWGNKEKDFELLTDATLTLAASTYYTISRITFDIPYFRIRAKENGTEMTFGFSGENVKYSDDLGENWNVYGGEHFKLSAGQEVWFDGTLADCDCNGNKQLFNANKVCYVAGPIVSLLANRTSLAANAFRSAFSKSSYNTGVTSCGTVTWVDIDPQDPLIFPDFTSNYCYAEMFRNCVSLTSVPDLPATELAEQCYFRMFYSCDQIKSIPSFPSSPVTFKGARVCYQMFQSCTSIQELGQPLFGGTMSLGTGCFEDMFAHCTGLTSVIPGLLPATTLAENCYRGMFQDTRFDRAPDLLAEKLAKECYRFMFSSCSNLTSIKCLATTNIGSGYTTNWVGNGGKVNIPNNSNCEFIKAPGISWPRTSHGIPDKWTVTDYSE